MIHVYMCIYIYIYIYVYTCVLCANAAQVLEIPRSVMLALRRRGGPVEGTQVVNAVWH